MVNSINYRYKTLETFDSHPEYSDMLPLYNNSTVQGFIARRHKAQVRDINSQDKIKAGLGATAGTLLPMLYLMKKQQIKNPLELKYSLSNMIMLSGSSILGGVLAGMIGEDKKTQNNKFKEGVFQFLNASVPAWIVGGSLKLSESSKMFNNTIGKILSMLGGLVVGMYGAASISNLLTDPKDKFPDRKLSLKDCIANIDDALGVLILAKFPCANKLKLERILPFIYSYCGYRAGKSN